MKICLEPSRPSGAGIAAPPGKSMAHRLLICAGLAEGVSVIENVARSEDISATLDCLAARGAGAVRTEDGAPGAGAFASLTAYEPESGTMWIRGADPFAEVTEILRCRESGSTLRFFIPLCALSEHAATLTGRKSLLARPLSVYETLFRERGLLFERSGETLTVRGPLRAGAYEVDGNVSSQFVSGLLFALPLLEGGSVLRLRPPVESRPYIDMTMEALAAFGVDCAWRDDVTLWIPGGQRYRPCHARVEGDWSNAAFFLALGVPVTGLDPASRQGDRVFTEYFDALKKGMAALDISDCPDLGPVLFVCAALRNGGVFTGTRRLGIKESDRAAAMAAELEKCGVHMIVEADRVIVGRGVRRPQSPLYGHNDHRIVMALSVLLASCGGVIEGVEAVRKSFPDFFTRLKAVGIEVKQL